MEIFEAPADGAVIVHVAGQVNSSNAPQLGQRLASLVERDVRAIVVDLSRLVHMTSAGFRSLLLADKRAGDAGGALVICGLQGFTLELFEIGGFLDMFAVAESRDDALRQAIACKQETNVQ